MSKPEKNKTILHHCKVCKEPIHFLEKVQTIHQRTQVEMGVDEKSGIHVCEEGLDPEYPLDFEESTEYRCECGAVVTKDWDEAQRILMKTLTDLALLSLTSYPLDVLVEIKKRGYYLDRGEWDIISTTYGNVCNECGQPGLVNRVQSGDSVSERIEMGKPYPRGFYHCQICEGKIVHQCLDSAFHTCGGDCANCDQNMLEEEEDE